MAKEKAEPKTDEPVPADDQGALVKAAKERLAAAVKDRPLQGYTGVNSDDVAVLVGAIKDADQDDKIKAIAAGASGAGKNVETWQKTENLKHLLEKVG